MCRVWVGKMNLALAVAVLLLLPAAAAAQNSTITGVVRDVTGGVLPGVTVFEDTGQARVDGPGGPQRPIANAIR